MKFKNKMSLEDQFDFLHYFNEVYSHGYSMKNTLVFLEKHIGNKSEMQQIVESFELGKPFSDILKILKFSDINVLIVSIAESSQNLKFGINKAREMTEIQINIRKQIIEKIKYPFILICIAIIMVVGFNMFLIPQIIEIQQSISATSLSPTSQIVIVILRFLPFVFIFSVFSCAIVVLIIYFQIRRGDIKMYTVIRKIPFVSNVFLVWFELKFSLMFEAYVTQNLGIFYLEQSIIKLPHYFFEKYIIKEISDKLSSGSSLANSIKSTNAFSDQFVKIVEFGVINDTLAIDLSFYITLLKSTLEKKINAIVKIISPIIMCVVATIILCAYLAFLLPMLEIISTM